MDSPLFEFTCKNFMVKRKEFCYAGFWTATLDMSSGNLTGCYGQGFKFNIFKDINRKIPFEPIGETCTCAYCINSSHFLSQGNIPSLLPLLSYGELRNRSEANWYTDEMKAFLYTQFKDSNSALSQKQFFLYKFQKIKHNIKKASQKFIFKLHFRKWLSQFLILLRLK